MATRQEELLERVAAVAGLPRPRDRRRIREAAGVSQSDVAAALGVSTMTVNRWERGLIRPRGQKAVEYTKLLEALDDAVGASP